MLHFVKTGTRLAIRREADDNVLPGHVSDHDRRLGLTQNGVVNVAVEAMEVVPEDGQPPQTRRRRRAENFAQNFPIVWQELPVGSDVQNLAMDVQYCGLLDFKSPREAVEEAAQVQL